MYQYLTAENALEAAQDTVEQVNAFTAYLQNHIPDLIGFGIKVLLSILVFVAGRQCIHLIRKIVRRSLEKSSCDKGVEQFVDSLLRFLLYFLLLFLIASEFGVDTTSVAALVASCGVAIGLALQGSLSNFAGGVLILLLKPFVVGDYIVEHATGKEGTVSEIQIFYTKLSTLDNKTIVIPNGSLTNTSITNVTENNTRQLDLRVSITYETDLKAAKKVAAELLEEEKAILKDQDRKVFVAELGDNAVILGIRGWVTAADYWEVKWRLQENLKLRFDEEKISMAYPQIVVHRQ